MTNRTSRFPWWRFLVPFGVQLGLILVVPVKSAYTYNFGTKATIQTIPVDPYDLLRGYSQTLRYDISSLSNLHEIPGGSNLDRGKEFYLVLGLNEEKSPPLPSKIIKITSTYPQDLEQSQVALKGKINNRRRAVYGLETYYMPESQRNQINREIRELQNDADGRRPFVVEVKIDRWGNSVPLSLWVGDRNYRF